MKGKKQSDEKNLSSICPTQCWHFPAISNSPGNLNNSIVLDLPISYDDSLEDRLMWHLHIICPTVASYIWVDQSERLQVQANLEEHCDTRPRKKWPLLAIQRVDLADVVVHGADHEAADRGEGHRVGEVRPVLRRVRVALAAMMMAMRMEIVRKER